MAKLSEIFSRKNEGGTDKVVIPLPAMPLRGHGATEDPGAETLADIGSRIGEEN